VGTTAVSFGGVKATFKVLTANHISATVPAGATTGKIQVANAGGTTRNTRSFAVITAPSITTQPASQTVNGGQTATFVVVASGTAPLNYQWSKNGSMVSGATSASYTTPPATALDDAAQFQVTVSNSGGSVTSNPAKLSVAIITTSNSTNGDLSQRQSPFRPESQRDRADAAERQHRSVRKALLGSRRWFHLYPALVSG
jgi:hypothetical protein